MKDILEQAKQFLRQQEELYGPELLLPKQPADTRMPVPKKLTAKKSPVMDELPDLKNLSELVANCKACALCKTRTQTVFGSGNPKAELMFIGEAPGADEDAQGLPFVGRAGQLLTKMIEEPRSLGIPRKDVYIANILKCRPPGNRKPLPEEVEQCETYLFAQIENIRPKFIVALGATAANTLLRNTTPISAMRGQFFNYHGTSMMVTFHPAALLRKQEWKKLAWQDMLTLKQKLQEAKSIG